MRKGTKGIVALQSRHECLGDGMALGYSRGQYKDDVSAPYTIDEGAVHIVSCFSGDVRFTSSAYCEPGALELVGPCDKGLVTCCSSEGNCTISAREPVCNVAVIIDKTKLLGMMEGDSRFLGVGKTLTKPDGIRLLGAYKPSPKTRMIATQVLECRLEGTFRRFFMEGKALEIISAFLERAVDTGSSGVSLSRGDVERVREAKRLLLEDLNFPPSTEELAQTVGINQFKLKAGFKAVYGCTIFQALRKHRMEFARVQLNDTRMTVSQVAASVGYTNMSHFAAAFRREFGVNPGALLRHQRHTPLS